jgi:hypothetical protein
MDYNKDLILNDKNKYHVFYKVQQFIISSSALFLISIVGGVESNWVHSTLRPPIGLLCQPRVIMMMEKLVEWLAGETEVFGESLPQCRFVLHKLHMLPGREPGPQRWEASD